MSELQIQQNHLPYAACLQLRNADSIDLVVIHCTELPDLATARKYGEQIHHMVSGTGNSGHYYIDRDGRVEQWVPPHRIAHHVRGFNKNSIGIELVNLGRYPNWYHTAHQEMTENYPPKQVDSLVSLLDFLHVAHASLQWITGHDLLDAELVPASDNPAERVYRKRDPGPLFPWDEVLTAVRLLPWL
jgi:N-acetylmuramoyl-L-alanine amidase